MKSFDVHAADLNINQNLLIEASAGTGKTYTIEKLFLRRLETPIAEKQVEPSEIAVVTFTRAAAAELQERIFAASTHRRLDEAAIETIHAFANRLISEFFGERAFSFIEETELQSIVADYFLTHDPDIVLQETEALLRFYGCSQKKLYEAISKGLYSCKKRESFHTLFQKLERKAKETEWGADFVREALQRLAEDFTGLCDREKKLYHEHVRSFAAFCTLFSDSSSKEKIKALFAAPFFPKKIFVKPRAKATRFDPQFLETLLNEFQPLLEEAFDEERILERLTSRVETFVTMRLRKLSLFTPDSLIHELEEALTNPEFVAFVQKRFRAVFIDEFQDTDPKQWKIFSTLFLDPHFPGYLYLVGDPKQAIYSFRNADVYSYIKAKEAFSSENQVTLSTNFRSSKNLIASMNALFQIGESAIVLPKLADRALPIQEVQPGREIEEIQDQKAPIHFIEVQEALGRKRNWPHEEAEEKFFAAVVDEIVALQLPLSSFAVLLSDRFQAERCQAFLETWGIKATLHRGKKLKESAAFQFLKRFQACLKQPKRKELLLNLLASEPLFYGEKELLQINSDLEVWADYVRFFRKLSSKKMGLAAAIGLFLDRFPVAAAEFLRDLEQLVEIASTTSLEDISEEIEVRFEPEESAVSLMTVFKSKGLEFDVVFALELASRTKLSDSEQEAEKMRKFYVAATRAKKRLYLPLLIELEGKAAETGSASPMEKFMCERSLSQFLERPRQFSHHLQQEKTPKAPLVHAEIVEERIAQSYAPFQKRRLFVDSFSSLQQESLSYRKHEEAENELPFGAQTGILLHRLIAKLAAPKVEIGWLEKELQGTILAPHTARVQTLLEQLFSIDLGGFTLKEVDFQKMYREMEFVYSDRKDHLMRGAIDCAFQHGDDFYLIDFKSGLYQSQKYESQAHIYCAAFTKYLKSLNIPENRLKGLFFIYLREGVAHLWKP